MDFSGKCRKLHSALVYRLFIFTLIDAAKIRFPSASSSSSFANDDLTKSPTSDHFEKLIPCNGSATLNYTASGNEYAYNVNGIPCTVTPAVPQSGTYIPPGLTIENFQLVSNASSANLLSFPTDSPTNDWPNFNFTWNDEESPSIFDAIDAENNNADDVRILYDSSTSSNVVPIQSGGGGGGSGSSNTPVNGEQQLVSENEIISLQNQYRWILDKPSPWKKRFSNLQHNSTNTEAGSSSVLNEMLRNKTRSASSSAIANKPLSYEDQKGFPSEFLDILGKGKA